jgi:hypothetical protein
MKAFLDRLGYLFHRPCFHGKGFTSLVVQGFYGGGKIERYLAFVGAGLGFDVVRGSCITGLEPMAEKDRRRMDTALDRQARRFRALLARPALRAPTLFQLLGFRMGRTCIRQQLTEADRDYVYYRDRGWLESGYFTPVRLGPLRRAAGALFDRFFARVYRRA